MYFVSLSTIANTFNTAELGVLGASLFVILIAIGLIIAIGRAIADVNSEIKSSKQKESTSNDNIASEIVSEDNSDIEPITDEIAESKQNNDVTEEELIEDDEVIEDEIIEDDEILEDNSHADDEIIEDIDNDESVTDDNGVIDEESVSNSNSPEEKSIDLDNIEEAIDLEIEENEVLEAPTSAIEKSNISPIPDENPIPDFIQPKAEQTFDRPEPIVVREISKPEFVRADEEIEEAPSFLDEPSLDNIIPEFSPNVSDDESAPDAFDLGNDSPDFSYANSTSDTAPEKLENYRTETAKEKEDNKTPEFSRPVNPSSLDLPDRFAPSKTEDIPVPEFMESELSQENIAPSRFDGGYPEEETIEPPEFNYSTNRVDDIPLTFEEFEGEEIPQTIEPAEPMFIAPLKPPPKGLYDEVPDKAKKQEKAEEQIEIVIPEGLTEEEQKLIDEQQALLDELTEEAVTEENEENETVGTCTDTSRFTAFENKLYNADNSIKYYYSELKNTLMAYKGIKSKLTNAGDSFKIGNTLVARITLNGNKLRLHLSLDPRDYNPSIYNHTSFEDVKAYKDIPLALEITKRADLSTATKLIQDAMGSKFVLFIDPKREYVDYQAYYTEKKNKRRT